MKYLTQHPLFGQDPAALWYSAAVLPDADTCLTDSVADLPSTELDQLHQILSGRLGMLGYKHRRLVLEQVLLVLPCRQVPLETTDLGGERESYILFCRLQHFSLLYETKLPLNTQTDVLLYFLKNTFGIN